MLDFVTMIKNFWVSIITLFDNYPLIIGGYKVSFFSLIFAFLVIGFAISYFWKGAKT